MWDKLAEKYDRLWVQKYSLGPTRRELLRRMEGLGVKRLLDIGCGTGQLIAEVLSASDIQCVGMDKSSAMIELARAKNPTAKFYTLDISDPLPEEIRCGGFDVITCTHSLPYYRNKPEAMKTIAELMGKASSAFFVQAAADTLYDKLVLYFTEKTAEQAEYLSGKAFLRLASPHFLIAEEFRIRERWFMPSIRGYHLKRKESNG